MSSEIPDQPEPDPGRKLMVVALIGVGLLGLGVLAAMGYFLLSRLDP